MLRQEKWPCADNGLLFGTKLVCGSDSAVEIKGKESRS